jgi:hypothetical protein
MSLNVKALSPGARAATFRFTFKSHRRRTDIGRRPPDPFNSFCKIHSAKIARRLFHSIPRKVSDLKSPGVHDIKKSADFIKIV